MVKIKCRKIILVLLGFIILVTGLELNLNDVKAAYTFGVTFEKFRYEELDDGTVEITDCMLKDEKVIIPSEYKGRKVTSIGYGAFSGLSNLVTVVIPEGVINIGPNAFLDDANLTTVYAPSTLKSIGSNAFYGTKWLANRKAQTNFVTLNKILVDATQCGSDVVIPGWITGIGSMAFDAATLTSVKIPKSVTYIGAGAFSGCDKLTKVELSTELTEIGSSAFFKCTGLTEISLPNSVKVIGEKCFYGCENLATVKLPVRLDNMEIGSEAFRETKWLANKQAENPLVVISKTVIDGAECRAKVVIPNGVTAIAGGAFYNNKMLEEVVMPDSVVNIGEGAFYFCRSLSSVTWPKNLKVIPEKAFTGDALTEVNIPYGVERIEEDAFSACGTLASIKMPSTVKYVGPNAFGGTAWMTKECEKNDYVVLNGFLLEIKSRLEDVFIPSNVKYVCEKALINADKLKTIHIPENVTIFSMNTFYPYTRCTIYGYDNTDASRYADFHKLNFVITPCKTPTLISATNSNSGVSVKWNKAEGAVGYYVYRKTDSGNWSRIATVNQSLAYLDKTAVSGVKYYYTVKAYDRENVSGCDTKGVSVIRVGQPDFTVSNGYSGINLNWTALNGVNQYNIYRKTAQSTNWTKVAAVTGTSWTDTDVTNGSYYQYTIKAVIGSVMSTCHFGKTMYRLTSPVMSSLTEASKGTAVATWSKNAKATGYQLRYATKLDMTGALTVSNTTNSNAKTIFGLNKGTMYYVQVRSFVVVDGVKYYSGWSNKKSVKMVK